ncbi:MAG: type II toxin-antitoxin system RelE/ParE family toxin [Bacteroides sp.]|nr:type II toxin-antitoxin system RelE/ParE family toxin [Bacteroides sp.]
MMQKYVLSKLAEKDLKSIWRYTAETWSRSQADRYVKGLLQTCADIAEAPMLLGRSYDHVRLGYRKFLFGKHVIFYRVQSSGIILISRILHEKMDVDRYL